MKKVLILSLLFLSAHFLYAQTQEEQIKAVVENYLGPKAPGLAIIATQGDKVLYKDAFGYRNINKGVELKGGDLFRIGSITKQFTAVAILKLAQEEKLDLEDPVTKYIANLKMEQDISIRQLLHHTGGLGNQSDIKAIREGKFEVANYPDSVLDLILTPPLRFAPGGNYAYSNLGYVVLGKIIEIVAGQSYEGYLKTTFFEPLSMQHTGFEYIDDLSSSMATGYSFVEGAFVFAAPIKMKVPFAAGALVSTIEDLAIWNKAVMSASILSDPYLKLIQEVHTLPNGQSTGYAMGYQIGNLQGHKTVKHDGIVNGFTAMAIYIPEKDLYVAVLANSDKYRDIEIPSSRIAAILMDEAIPTETVSLSALEIEKYQGKFQNGENEIQIIAHDGDLMSFRSGGGGVKIKLSPIGANSFLLDEGVEQLAFDFSDGKTKYHFKTLRDITTWEKVGSVKAFQTLDMEADALDEYVGKYQVPNMFVFEVLKIDGKMYGQVGNDRKEIFCYEKDKFCARSIDVLLNFSRDKEGKIAAVTLLQGREFKGDKLKE